jgi:putative transposase
LTGTALTAAVMMREAASMSRKGNCWDNACSETLFGSLKVERLHARNFHTRRQAKDNTLEWMLW